MHEFIFPAIGPGHEAAEEIDHVGACAVGHPDIAVDYPDDIAFGGAVAVAHVADLGIGTEGGLGCGIWIFFLDKDSRVEGRKVVEELLEDGVGWVIPRRDAEVDRELLAGIGLFERCGETIVEIGLEAFDGAEYGNMGNLREGKAGGYGSWRS